MTLHGHGWEGDCDTELHCSVGGISEQTNVGGESIIDGMKEGGRKRRLDNM